MCEHTVQVLRKRYERLGKIRVYRISRITIPETAVAVEFASLEEFYRFMQDAEAPVAFETPDGSLYHFVDCHAVFYARKG